MEQIRVIKEMRDRDKRNGRSGWLVRPRYMVWENVDGARSSGNPKGADFAAVLEETIRIVEPKAPPVSVPKNGWASAGCLYDEMGRWSVAWRVHDAQFWGVPQRRKRIALVADFGGLSAPEVLFEREGLRRDHNESEQTGKETPTSVGTSSDSASYGWPLGFRPENVNIYEEKATTLCNGTRPGFTCGIFCIEGNGARNSHKGDGYKESETSYTLNTVEQHAVAYNKECIAFKPQNGAKARGIGEQKECSPTLSSSPCGFISPAVAYNIGSYTSNAWKSDNPNSGVYETDVSKTLDALNCGAPVCNQGGTAIVEPILLESNQNHATVQTDGICTALPASMGMGGGYVPMVTEVYDARGNGNGKVAPTITGDHENRVTDYTALCIGNGQADQTGLHNVAGALNCMHDQQAVLVKSAIGIDRAAYNMGKNAKGTPAFDEEKSGSLVSRGPNAVCETDVYAVDCRNGTESTETNGTLQAKDNGGTSLNLNNVCRQQSVVRRLTPLECERLQNFPDGWTDIGDWVDEKGKIHKTADSQRYKALGNSIALPFWFYLLRRISAQYERPATLGSLFDGIGGFPLCWERCNGKGTARWASEIEPFCIAVTKHHFGEG